MLNSGKYFEIILAYLAGFHTMNPTRGMSYKGNTDDVNIVSVKYFHTGVMNKLELGVNNS